ncbi:hypothetical protein Tco_0265320 [Tanacetum coccineum]
MVINSPCLTDTKNWLFQCKRHMELASPKQMDLGKDFSNPLMADSLPKTIWLSIHHVLLQRIGYSGENGNCDDDRFELIELMILCTNFLTMVRDLENLKNHLSDNEESLGEDASKHWRIDDVDAEVTFINETSNDAINKKNKISNSH